VILAVSDLERSTRFYRDVLGLSVGSPGGGEFVFLDGGGVTLALRQLDGGRTVTPGDAEVSFEVDDVAAVFSALSSRGVAFARPPRPVTEAGGKRLLAADFRDPDGYVLSITGWTDAAGRG
jgi:catechol 2,3-dioxygenase-like lactoylglutathione lyase family enzyme